MEYLKLAPSMPCRLTPEITFSQLTIGNVVDYPDANGQCSEEILIAGPSVNVNTVELVSYFNWGDASPDWPATPSQLVAVSGAAGNISNGAGLTVPLSASNQYYLADVNGDKRAELVTWDPMSGTLSVASWNGSAIEPLWSSQPSPINPEDLLTRLFFADVDGDGNEEILSWNPTTLILTVSKWQASEVTQVWQASSVIASGSTTVKMSPLTEWSVAKLGGDDVACLVCWDPSLSSLAVLQWQNSQMEILWTNESTGPNPITGQNQLYAADLDGDGSDEIVTWNPNLLTLSFSKWQNSSLASFGSDIVGSIKSPTGTLVNLSDSQWYVADIDGDKSDEILTFNTSTGHLSVLKWQDSQLACVWTNGKSGEDPLAAQTSLYFADLDGDGQEEILTWNPIVPPLLVSKWQNSEISQVAISGLNIPGWSLDFIVSGPKTTFVDHPFQGAQLEIYQFISQKLDPNDSPDIRSTYIKAITDWDTLKSKLAQMDNPGYPSADWDAVKEPLLNELGAIKPVKSLIGDMNTLLPLIQSQQSSDLSTDVTNLTTISPGSEVAYWLGQIMSAVFWAACATPEGKTEQAGLAILASLFGSAVSALGGDSVQTVSYVSLQGLIEETYVTAKTTSDSHRDTILSDAVMLPLIGALVAGEVWTWDPEQADTAVSSQIASNANRIVFYQTLIPSVFKIYYFEAVNDDYPGSYGFFESNNEPPAHAYWVEPINGNYNVYILLAGGSLTYSYPSKELSDDLFSTLAISKEAFFKGTNGWQSIDRERQQRIYDHG
jgi:hypothetical protein